MTLYFEEEGEIRLPISCEETARLAIETALDVLDCPYETEINLLLTSFEFLLFQKQIRKIFLYRACC